MSYKYYCLPDTQLKKHDLIVEMDSASLKMKPKHPINDIMGSVTESAELLVDGHHLALEVDGFEIYTLGKVVRDFFRDDQRHWMVMRKESDEVDWSSILSNPGSLTFSDTIQYTVGRIEPESVGPQPADEGEEPFPVYPDNLAPPPWAIVDYKKSLKFFNMVGMEEPLEPRDEFFNEGYTPSLSDWTYLIGGRYTGKTLKDLINAGIIPSDIRAWRRSKEYKPRKLPLNKNFSKPLPIP